MSSRKTRPLLLEKQARFFVLFILATIPLLFGAVHPFVQGLYTALLLIGCGGWLLLNMAAMNISRQELRWLIVPLLLLLYTGLTAMPLPFSIVETLSPERATALRQVNELAGMNLRWAPLSYSGPVTLKEAIFYFSLLLYFLCTKSLLVGSRSFSDKILRVITIVGVIEALYGLLQAVSPSLGVLWLACRTKAAHGTIIYKNQYAAFLNLCWPMALAVALAYYRKQLAEIAKYRKKHKRQKIRTKYLKKKLAMKSNQAPVFLFATVLIMLAVFFSLSRAGVLSMFFVLTLISIFLPFSGRKKLALFGSILGLLMAYGTILGFDAIISRFALLDTAGATRIKAWQASLPMLYDYPWTGIGLESYKLLSPIYLKHFTSTALWDRAHNEYLELLIELGIPAATMLFFWISSGLTICWITLWKLRRIRFRKISNTTLAGIAGSAAISGFLLHGVVDFAWRLPANLLYCTTAAALVSHARLRLKPALRTDHEHPNNISSGL